MILKDNYAIAKHKKLALSVANASSVISEKFSYYDNWLKLKDFESYYHKREQQSFCNECAIHLLWVVKYGSGV